jgi:5-methylthioadenosine/S-adenosylhomocysteine deaminase
MSLLRGYADDMVLQDWLSQKIWPLEAHLTP